MENEMEDKKINLAGKMNDITFELDYEGQNLNNNENFINWKKMVLNKLDNNAKLFKCKNHKILFFVTNNEYKKEYLIKCPKGHHICYFCGYSGYKITSYYCCIRRSLAKAFLNSNDPDNSYLNNLSFFFPGLNIFGFFLGFSNILFERVATKKSIKNENLNLVSDNKLDIINTSYIGITVLYSICFLLLNIYFLSFLFLISILFKFYPMKYLFDFLGFVK